MRGRARGPLSAHSAFASCGSAEYMVLEEALGTMFGIAAVPLASVRFRVISLSTSSSTMTGKETASTSCHSAHESGATPKTPLNQPTYLRAGWGADPQPW